jgi:hypothetical protein
MTATPCIVCGQYGACGTACKYSGPAVTVCQHGIFTSGCPSCNAIADRSFIERIGKDPELVAELRKVLGIESATPKEKNSAAYEDLWKAEVKQRERNEARAERDFEKQDRIALAKERDEARKSAETMAWGIGALEKERDEARADAERAGRDRDTLVRMLVSEFGWEDTSYLHAMTHVENAIRNLRAELGMVGFERDEARAALATARREGAEAMREAAAGAAWHSSAMALHKKILALPLPGDKPPAR